MLDDAEVPDLSDDEFLEIYEQMKLARHFDQRAVSLQRQGRMGTYPPLSGQEAAQVASAHALDTDDWMFPSYREHGAALVRGFGLKRTLLYWMGHEQGNAIPEDVNLFTVAVPIATQIPHATGAAWASRLQGEEKAFLCYFGDGATSEGDFHEGLNFAGVFDAPAVFFCNNNQWAISVPREKQTASETIAQKANAYGFEGVRVDGNDVFAVHDVVTEALENAKDGDGPTLIEAVTYRRGAHTTTDDPSVYRDEDDAADWLQEDPLDRSRTYLEEEFGWSDEDQEAVEQWATEEVARAVEAAEDHTGYEPEEMFEHVYEEMPAHLREQRRQLPEDPQVGH